VRTQALEALGAELAVGDLRDVASLRAACDGVGAVVSTATALMSRIEDDSIQSVDHDGQLDLVAAAEAAGVGQFVFVSFPPTTTDDAFQRAKRAVEARLRESSMAYTVVHAASFAEVWLSPFLGFDPLHGRARVFGDGTKPTNWVSMLDVAQFVADAVGSRHLARKTLPLGGPDALSYHDVLALYAANGAKDVAIEYVPEADLEAQLRAAADPRQEALAAAMLGRARGQVVPSDEACALWSGRLTPVGELVARAAAATTTS
jgi:NADH dehydrogenase